PDRLGCFFVATPLVVVDSPATAFDLAQGLRRAEPALFLSVVPDLPPPPPPVEAAAAESAAGMCWVDDQFAPANVNWAVRRVRAPEAQAYSAASGRPQGGEGVRVGHLDTGYADHAAWGDGGGGAIDLAGSYNFVDDNGDATDPLETGPV